MSVYCLSKNGVVLSNGRCSNCNVLIRKTDKEDKDYWFYLVGGIKKSKINNKEYMRCHNCKIFLAT